MRGVWLTSLLVLLGGCAVPPAISVASLVADGLSYFATGKSVTDHGISMVTREDCAVFRAVKGEAICREEGQDSTAMAFAPTGEEEELMPLPGSYTVFFDFDSAKLTGEAQAIITSAASGAKKAKPKQILLSGHADRAGAGSYNVRLSERRVNAVAAALIKAGVSPSIINVSFFGEGKPRLATPDGKREHINRRVEIVFNPHFPFDLLSRVDPARATVRRQQP